MQIETISSFFLREQAFGQLRQVQLMNAYYENLLEEVEELIKAKENES
jgi:hypothetical protein